MYACFKHMAVPQILSETRQIRLFWGSAYASGGFGCPIGIQQINKVEISPQNGADNGEQPGKTMSPRTQKERCLNRRYRRLHVTAGVKAPDFAGLGVPS